MKARDLLIQLTTMCANNPHLLDTEVEIVLQADSSAVNPVSLELTWAEGSIEDESEGPMPHEAPTGIVINAM